MALIATQTVTQQGLVPTYQSVAAGGDQFEPSENTILLVKNGDASPHTVTVAVTATAFGQPVQNVAVVVAAGAQALIGPFEPGEVAQPSTGLANVSYDATPASLQIAAIEV